MFYEDGNYCLHCNGSGTACLTCGEGVSEFPLTECDCERREEVVLGDCPECRGTGFRE